MLSADQGTENTNSNGAICACGDCSLCLNIRYLLFASEAERLCEIAEVCKDNLAVVAEHHGAANSAGRIALFRRALCLDLVDFLAMMQQGR